VSSITLPPPIILTLLRQRYDFVEAGCRTKIGEKEERREQDQGQVLSQICEEERKQSLGPGQGHPERSMGGEGGSVSVDTLPAPPVSMTTTTTTTVKTTPTSLPCRRCNNK